MIVVVDIKGDKVRLGIEAPKGVPVHRREVYDAIRRDEEQKLKEKESQAPCQDENLTTKTD